MSLKDEDDRKSDIIPDAERHSEFPGMTPAGEPLTQGPGGPVDDQMLIGAPENTLKCEEEMKPKFEATEPGAGIRHDTVEPVSMANTYFPEAENEEPSIFLDRNSMTLPPLPGIVEPMHQPRNEEPQEIIIIKDEPEDMHAIEWLSSPRPTKRQRLVVEVFVDTWAVFKQRRNEELKKIKAMKNPKAKTDKKFELPLDLIRDRFKHLVLDGYEVRLEKDLQEVVVSRRFLSDVYGGNMQSTFPRIAPERVAQHGIDDFMFVTLQLHPRGPQMPGKPGIFLDTESGGWTGIHRVFTRLDMSKWLYIGMYVLELAPPLSKHEWLMLDVKVRRSWITYIQKKGWAGYMRARIVARRELGRKPTREEWLKVFKDQRDTLATDADIKHALDSGEEVLQVSIMKCVGYDEAFQRTLCEKFPVWVPPPPKQTKKGEPRANKSAKSKTVKTAPTSTSSRKSKRAKSVESEGNDDDNDEEEDEEEYDEGVEIIEILDDEPAEVVYKPRGTRSRPIDIS